jgi:hypothetical protein
LQRQNILLSGNEDSHLEVLVIVLGPHQSISFCIYLLLLQIFR